MTFKDHMNSETPDHETHTPKHQADQRPLVETITERAAELKDNALTWLRGGPDAEPEHTEDGKEKVHPRMRAAQIGAVVAVAGVLGAAVTTATGSEPERPENVDQAAQANALAPMAAPQEPAKAAPQEPAKAASPSTEDSGPIPGPPAEGIDVSNHNGPVDWKQVAGSGQDFTFVLATDGTDFSNPMYSEQYHGAKDAGMIAGAYHFARPSDSGGADQANRMLDVIDYSNDGKTLPPVLDLEVDPNGGGCYGMTVDQMHKWTTEFNDTVKKETGKEPIIYANPSFWNECMGGTDKFNDHALWLAAYEVDQPSVPTGFQKWNFWQWSDEGTVPGIDGPTDMNKFQGSVGDLKRLAGK